MRLVVAGGADDDLARRRCYAWFARHGLLVDASPAFGLFACTREISLLELRQHFFREQLDRRT